MDLPDSRESSVSLRVTQPRVAKSTGKGGPDKSGRLSAVHTSRPPLRESIQQHSGACSECRASVSTHKAVALWVLVCVAFKKKKKVNVLDVFLRNVGLLGIINFT